MKIKIKAYAKYYYRGDFVGYVPLNFDTIDYPIDHRFTELEIAACSRLIVYNDTGRSSIEWVKHPDYPNSKTYRLNFINLNEVKFNFCKNEYVVDIDNILKMSKVIFDNASSLILLTNQKDVPKKVREEIRKQLLPLIQSLFQKHLHSQEEEQQNEM